MSTLMRSRGARGVAVTAYLAIGALAGAMLVGVPHIPLAGTRVGLALAFAIAIGPIALPFAVARPLVLLAIWAAFVPFDNLFKFSGIGPVEKLLGAGAALGAILSILVRHRSFAPPLQAAVWAAYAVFALASLIWAPNPDFGIQTLGPLVGLLVVGVALSMVPADEMDLKALFFGIVASGVGASIYSLVLFAKNGHSLFMQAGAEQVIDHNHFGAALLLPFVCATMAGLASTKAWVRVFCAAASLTCLAGIGSSMSRGAMIAAGVALLYLLLRSRHRWRLLPCVAAIPLLLAAVPSVLARFSDPDSSSGAGRFEIWQIGLAAFKHQWLIGSGFGTFKQSYQAAFLEFSQQSATAQRVNDSHNLIVQNAVELGIIGLVLVLFAWWFQFRTLRMISPESDWGDVRVTLEATVVALFTMALSVDLMWFKYTWLAFISMWIVRSAYSSAASLRSELPLESGTGAFPSRLGRDARVA